MSAATVSLPAGVVAGMGHTSAIGGTGSRKDGSKLHAAAMHNPTTIGAARIRSIIGRTRLRGRWVPVRRLRQAVEQSLHDQKEQRNEENAEKCSAQHAAEDAGADRPLRAGAGAGGEGERQNTESKGQGGHEDRTQTVLH